MIGGSNGNGGNGGNGGKRSSAQSNVMHKDWYEIHSESPSNNDYENLFRNININTFLMMLILIVGVCNLSLLCHFKYFRNREIKIEQMDV